MKQSPSRVRRGVLAILLLAIPGCWQGPPARVYPDKPDPRAGAAAIELYDTDKDGLLDGKELEKVPGLKAALKQVDSNKDGKISAEEISARIQQWADTKVGRISLICLITHNGRTMAGATVRFVPEKFLGGEMKTAEGTTDSYGVATMACGAARGICPGFYRVEITKSGETIPVKYNAETQLGQEAAQDTLPVGPLKIDLKY
jgi:hypothetical protein